MNDAIFHFVESAYAAFLRASYRYLPQQLNHIKSSPRFEADIRFHSLEDVDASLRIAQLLAFLSNMVESRSCGLQSQVIRSEIRVLAISRPLRAQ